MQLPVGEVSLRHNSLCKELDQFLAQNQWDHTAVITAFNPGSIDRAREENNNANQKLEWSILQEGFQYHPGMGLGDDADWPPEDSFLICGIPLEAALKLAEKFGQYAIVFHTLGQKTVIELTEIGKYRLVGVVTT